MNVNSEVKRVGHRIHQISLRWKRPAQLIKAFDSVTTVREFLRKSTGVREGLSVEKHTRAVLGRLRKYPFFDNLPRGLDYSGVKLTMTNLSKGIIFHDANKLDRDMSKEAQHLRAVTELERHRDFLQVDESEMKLLKALITADVLGTFFKSVLSPRYSVQLKVEFFHYLKTLPETEKMDAYFAEVNKWERYVRTNDRCRLEDLRTYTEQALQKITDCAKDLGIAPKTFLHYVTIYFQCDCSSYSWDAGGRPSMEFLYKRNESATNPKQQMLVFDRNKGRILFSDTFEPFYNYLYHRCP